MVGISYAPIDNPRIHKFTAAILAITSPATKTVLKNSADYNVIIVYTRFIPINSS
ncbi:hypothetical protein DPMN_099479 [Dreissena polymorpha]|uniref:Uncharacterized protein n=1 Tax=Dreissena polymorpha TaxID=45954 RepID=A0A9D4LFK3_DREPO|nr:hypothetical protein DPMN_099479 [Dreissena polymorpha]